MRGIVALIVLVLVSWISPRAAESRDMQSDESDALSAIEKFLDRPMESSADVRRRIVDFAEENEHVAIVLDEPAMPWIREEKEYRGASLVLCAYIAGSLRSQLETRVWRDDPYSGLLQVARVYRAIKDADAKLALPSLDQLARDHADGKLAARAAEIETARAKKPEPK